MKCRTGSEFGTLFDIQRHATHDGPGIRTTLFFKGCNLRCQWCHNPESFRRSPELEWFPRQCISCGACVGVCPNGAAPLLLLGEAERELFRLRCSDCGACTLVCHAGARVLAGRIWTVGEVMPVVLADKAFYRRSGGGVTCSGGEPLLQPAFLEGILHALRAEGIHTALDTAGNVPWPVFERVLPLVDLVLFDFKVLDAEAHHAATGVDNRLILENLAHLCEKGIPLWVRIPVVPGVNASDEALAGMASHLRAIGHHGKTELLPMHHMGSGKYESLGRVWPMQDVAAPEDASMRRWRELFTNQ